MEMCGYLGGRARLVILVGWHHPDFVTTLAHTSQDVEAVTLATDTCELLLWLLWLYVLLITMYYLSFTPGFQGRLQH